MKLISLLFILISIDALAQSDPCAKKDYSNVEMRNCYSAAKDRVDKKISSVIDNLQADFKKEASDEKRQGNDVISACMGRASSELEKAQRPWLSYRDHHCQMVVEWYTTGSGAGTAYEECEYRMGQERLRELKLAFK